MDGKTQRTSPNPELDPSKWTNDQELTLMKAITNYKPAGMHKHFRMLAIHDYMLQSGTVNQETDLHTSIPGIWAKLDQLYDLKKLDEREDAVVGDTFDEKGKVIDEYWRDFELPAGEDGDFERLMWEKRLAPEGSRSSSADATTGEGRLRRESPVADSDDPRSSPIGAGSTRGSATRGTRSARKAGGANRLAEVKDEVKHEGRSSRRTSKAASPVDEDTEMQDVENVEEEEGSEEEEESEDQDESQEDTPTRQRGRGGRRGRGRRGRRRG